MKLYKETFAAHNFLWTQWKKLKHFQYLPPTVTNGKFNEEGFSDSSSDGSYNDDNYVDNINVKRNSVLKRNSNNNFDSLDAKSKDEET